MQFCVGTTIKGGEESRMKVVFVLMLLMYRSFYALQHRMGPCSIPTTYQAVSSSTSYSMTSKFTPVIMDALIERVKENNVIDFGECEWGAHVPFVVDGITYGYLKNDFAEKIGVELSSTFQLVRGTVSTKKITFTKEIEGMDMEGRTNALLEACKLLRNKGKIRGWRNEMLPVSTSFSAAPAFLIERAAYPIFGIKGYGVHVNGYVCKDSTSRQPTHLFVATRSKSKSTWPGMLDHIVAGAQPADISPSANVIKECSEEANIDESLAKQARSIGAVSYQGSDEFGHLKRDTLFCFDLELPESFVPTPIDGEVESFELQSIDWVIDKVVQGGTKGYKPNCNLVIIDFLIRHGFVPADANRYLELVGLMRSNGVNEFCC